MKQLMTVRRTSNNQLLLCVSLGLTLEILGVFLQQSLKYKVKCTAETSSRSIKYKKYTKSMMVIGLSVKDCVNQCQRAAFYLAPYL